MNKKILLIFGFLMLIYWGTPVLKAEAYTVILDPGHGGYDPGAVKNGLIEKDLNLRLTNKIKEKLEPYVDVILTRTNDKYISLQERANFANSLKPDLFISIHHDSNYKTSPNGISTHYSSYRPNIDLKDAYVVRDNNTSIRFPVLKEVDGYLYYNDNGTVRNMKITTCNCTAYDPTPTKAAADSRILALDFADQLAKLGFNRMYTTTGARDNILAVTRWMTMPSVLIENGFISNPEEAKKVSNPIMQEKMADSIAKVILEYFNIGKVQMKNVHINNKSPQQVDIPITLTANAIGESEKLYKFWIAEDGQWKVLKDYSPSNSFTWTPSKVGNYEFSIYVKDKNSNKTYDDHKYFQYKIVPQVDMVNVTTDLESPQAVNAGINITANAEGGSKKLYKFWTVVDGKWTVIKDYSEENTFKWVPEKEGNYPINVHVKDLNSPNSYDDYILLSGFRIYPVAKMNKVTLSANSPQKEGTAITLTVDASGGVEKEYKFWVEKNGKWEVLRDYSPSNSYTWTPLEEGDYGISVYVKDKNSSKTYDDYKYFKYEIEDIPVVMNKVDFSVSSPQKEGAAITLTADASGGVEKEYKFWVEKNGKWEVLRDYSPSNSYTWTPLEEGDYGISVYVKDKNSSKSYDDYKYLKYEIEDIPVVMNKVDYSVSSPQKEGTAITLTADASGGVEKEYKFWVEKNGKWEMLRDYSPSNSYTWTPLEEGDYGISVYVKDKNSSKTYDDYKYFKYEIEDNSIVLKEIIFDKVSPQPLGSTLNITVNAYGGSNKLYKFWIVKNGEWKLLRDYSSSKSIKWVANEAGNYSFSVHVKDETSKKEYDTYKLFKYTIKE